MCDCVRGKLQDIEERLKKVEARLEELEKNTRFSNTAIRNHVYRITCLEDAARQIKMILSEI